MSIPELNFCCCCEVWDSGKLLLCHDHCYYAQAADPSKWSGLLQGFKKLKDQKNNEHEVQKLKNKQLWEDCSLLLSHSLWE